MLTKAGGVVLGAHGSDTVVAGARQLWTGEPIKTLTQEGGEAVASRLGLTRKMPNAPALSSMWRCL